MAEIFKANYDSPIGNLVITSDRTSILECTFSDKQKQSEELPEILKNALKQLDEYFNRERKLFNLDLSPQGTEFQENVWNELTKIPYGETTSYSKIAESTGNKNAVRAVGNANSQNPISIIIPCHRVIGADGSLVGYSGGIVKKKWLLDFERSI